MSVSDLSKLARDPQLSLDSRLCLLLRPCLDTILALPLFRYFFLPRTPPLISPRLVPEFVRLQFLSNSYQQNETQRIGIYALTLYTFN